MTNPYQAPVIADSPVSEPLYSPNQIFVAGFLGGPLPPLMFLSQNSKVLKREKEAKQYMWIGIIFVVLLIGVAPFLPDKFPNYIIPFAFGLAGKKGAENHQRTKLQIQEDPGFHFQSNGKVFYWCLFGVLLVLCLGFLYFWVLELLGFDLLS